jgi:hypothetical protein
MPQSMRVALTAIACACVLSGGVREARAQDPPPPISRLVFDIRGTTRNFPDSPDLAASRGLNASELPGRGLGFDAAAHLHLFKWKAITFGAGGQFTIGRAHLDASESAGVRAVTETLTSLNSDLSLNFGDGEGWSYLSAGPGFSIWELAADASGPTAADEERLRTFNYGGGARWFAHRRYGFHFDVRFYNIDPGTPSGGFPGSPRSRVIVIGAGVSVRPWR